MEIMKFIKKKDGNHEAMRSAPTILEKYMGEEDGKNSQLYS